MNPPLAGFLPRRRYFVKRGLQGRLIIGVLSAALLTFVLMMVDYYFSFGKNAGMDFRALDIFIRSQKLPLIQLTVFVFVLVAVTVILSHRVAGPLINLERSLERAGQGDLTHHIRLRPTDQLKEIRDAYNRMVDSLHARVKSDRAYTDEVRRTLERLLSTPGLGPGEQNEIKKALELLSSIARQYKI